MTVVNVYIPPDPESKNGGRYEHQIFDGDQFIGFGSHIKDVRRDKLDQEIERPFRVFEGDPVEFHWLQPGWLGLYKLIGDWG